jgi:cytochrome c oxidase subunit 1
MATQAGAATHPGTHGHAHDDADYLSAQSGWRSWAFTLDHKRLGVMYLVATTAAFLVGGIFALLVRTELLTPGRTIVDPDWYNKFFTLHGAIMVFLFIIPGIPGALGNFCLPLMLGAKDVAFPRLNLASFWIYGLGAIFALYSIATNAVDTGWTFYTPYSQTTGTSVIAMTLGAFILGFSSILTGVNFIATIHKLRAPGLHWKRLPLFVWALYATSVIQVLATPVLAITLLLLVVEKVLGIGIFNPRLGGDPILFQHFFWFYSHPAVYIMILPGMGIVSELIATFSRRKIFGYMFVAMSSIGLALLAFLVWAHHMFVAGMSEYATMVFSGLTFLVAIPSAVKVFNWTATLYKGSVSFESPMLYGLAFIVLFTVGGLTGLPLATVATDVHLHDTYYVVAHFHYTMVGGTVFAFLGGLHYWWPKITGRMYEERLAQIAFALVFTGFNMTFFTQFLLGSHGMPRRYYDYLDQFQPLHGFSSVGSYVLGAGFVVMLVMFLRSLRNGPKAPPNPWGSAGFEWQTASPPIAHNFHATPVITRGPYDYHLATDEELYSGFPEDRDQAVASSGEEDGGSSRSQADVLAHAKDVASSGEEDSGSSGTRASSTEPPGPSAAGAVADED